MENPIDQNALISKIKMYVPLIVIFIFCVILSLVLMSDQHPFVYQFMGIFLSIFSLFKWMDIKGFARSFVQYDLVSKFFPPYLYLFPLLELALGVGYLKLIWLPIVNIITMIVMGVNGISIGKALIKKKKIECACLGSFVQLPLSVVSLFETGTMFFMAAWMI